MRSTKNLSQIQAKIQRRKTRIEQFEREGRFNEDIEDDLEAKELLPQNVDYLAKKVFHAHENPYGELFRRSVFFRTYQKGKTSNLSQNMISQ